MERTTEKRKRGKDQTWDHEKKEMKKTTNERKKRQVTTTTTDNDDGNDDGISYKLEKMTNNNDPGGQKINIVETTYDDNEKGEIGVFDFPWLKKGEDVNFRAEIDELCLDSTFATACCCSTSYGYDDLETLSIFPTTCCCNNNNIATTTTTSNPCSNDLYDTNIKAFDLNLDLDLIDQFFVENLSTTGIADQSSHDNQMKMNKIEDEELKAKT